MTGQSRTTRALDHKNNIQKLGPSFKEIVRQKIVDV
jgi:hypothetical protein